MANDLQIGIQDSYAVNYNFINNFIHSFQVGLAAAGVISNNSTGSASVVGRILNNNISDIRGRRGINTIAQSSLNSYRRTPGRRPASTSTTTPPPSPPRSTSSTRTAWA